jgi:hypothetical protein
VESYPQPYCVRSIHIPILRQNRRNPVKNLEAMSLDIALTIACPAAKLPNDKTASKLPSRDWDLADDVGGDWRDPLVAAVATLNVGRDGSIEPMPPARFEAKQP